MALRIVFIVNHSYSFDKMDINFQWKNDKDRLQMSKSNIASLHDEIKKEFPNSKILEISSASSNELGRKLSAFNLMLNLKSGSRISVECLFQGSKVFEKGGPYTDILTKSSIEAKRDSRLRNSGKVIGFRLFNKDYKINPATLFYNWLYINALNANVDLGNELMNYSIFTDIMFNSKYAINCQAEACSIYVSLRKAQLLDKALSDIETFEKIVYNKNV